MESLLNDIYFMRLAINEAEKALEKGEVPIGCVIISNDLVIARAHNLTETLRDATAHAEMQAFTSAAEYIGAKYLKDCTLYVTLEPCIMCLGASYWTQITRIIYGATDKKHTLPIDKKIFLHPKTTIIGGVLEQECAELLSAFFQQKRREN